MNHPGIYQIGHIADDGMQIKVYGWGLTLCLARCTCHCNPATGQPAAIGDEYTGSLGLAQYRACACCTAWTVDELVCILCDLSQITGLQVA